MIRNTLMVVFVLVIGARLVSPVLVHAQDNSNTYVLVHGAFQDSSGWDAVIESLESAGHTAVAVELPGRGEDAANAASQTLAGYRDAVIAVVNAQSEPVILVGHSFGGMVISEVAEAIPAQITALVYLAAYLPQTDDTLVTLAENDHFSQLGIEGNFLISEDFTLASVAQPVFASAFCPDCDEAQAAIVAASQLDEPLAPLGTPAVLTDANFGAVRKVYILTAEDIVVSPQLQAYMLSRTPVDRVYALNTGHAPYISAPQALADVLLEPGILTQ